MDLSFLRAPAIPGSPSETRRLHPLHESDEAYHTAVSQKGVRGRTAMEREVRRDQGWATAEYVQHTSRKRICQCSCRVGNPFRRQAPIAQILIEYRGSPESLESLMSQKRVGAYVGIDPTAPSLHVGHLVPLMALFWMYIHGFQSITLVSAVDPSIMRMSLTCKDRRGDCWHWRSNGAYKRSRTAVASCQEGEYGHHALST